MKIDKKTSSVLIALVLLIAAAYLLMSFRKPKGESKPADDKKPGDKKPDAGSEESGYLLTGAKCACKDEFGNIYRGDELLLGDGSRVCLCPDYFAVYGYPVWWGGYYGWRYRRPWHGGHRRGGHRPGPAPAPGPGPAPLRVPPVRTGMRMGGGMMGGGGRGGFGGGGMGGGRR